MPRARWTRLLDTGSPIPFCAPGERCAMRRQSSRAPTPSVAGRWRQLAPRRGRPRRPDWASRTAWSPRTRTASLGPGLWCPAPPRQEPRQDLQELQNALVLALVQHGREPFDESTHPPQLDHGPLADRPAFVTRPVSTIHQFASCTLDTRGSERARNPETSQGPPAGSVRATFLRVGRGRCTR